MRIEGKKVILRPIEENDTENIVRWRNSPEVRSRFIYQEEFTIEGHNHWLETQVKTGRVEQMIIIEKESGRDIGSAFIRDINKDQRKAEYGLFIGESDIRTKGLGCEVTNLMLKYAFGPLQLHRIYSRVIADNIISLRSAERAGLRREGYCRDEVFLNGSYHDVVMMGAIATDCL